MTTLNEYQERAKETDELTPAGSLHHMGMEFTQNELRLAFGIDGEAGELAEKYKKSLRNSDEYYNVDDTVKELGDILWYIALLADELGVTLEEIADKNLAKLEDRKEREVLAGSGDNR